MAVFSGVVRSGVLAMDTGLTVFLPHDRPKEVGQRPCKVLYLLHGMGDNHTSWTRHTSIERYARDKGIAVIMPEVQRSFYCDMAYGMNYFTYLTVELPEMCTGMFPISPAREDTYVAGLSMGGYGALKCGLVRPDRYAGCASFSGAVDVIRITQEHANERLADEYRGILGLELRVDDYNDPLFLSQRLAEKPPEQRPDIVLTCGEQDFLYDINLGFKKHLENLGIDFTFRSWPGEHVWTFWDQSVKMLLDHWF